ncbi:hypothetical protein FB451DRAFT_127960 [Mycena latifolia]|nr:hypothetical protein FB451DRAFT_127960 [Mycena latifolia]
MFSSSWSLTRRREGVCGVVDAVAPRLDGERSARVGGCTRIACVIARTGLGCGSGNSARVDVAWLGFICSVVTKLGLKGLRIRRGPHRHEFCLRHITHRLSLPLHDCPLPARLHLREADDVEALKRMCAVRRVPQQDDVVGPREVKKLLRVMRAVAIEEKDPWEAIGVRLGRGVKDLDQPFISKLAIGPPVDRFRDARWSLFPLFHADWKLTPGKITIGGTTIFPSPRIVTTAVMF